jgi:hypothetical protein
MNHYRVELIEGIAEDAQEARADAAHKQGVIDRARAALEGTIEDRSVAELLAEIRAKFLNRQSYDDVRRIEALAAMLAAAEGMLAEA